MNASRVFSRVPGVGLALCRGVLVFWLGLAACAALAQPAARGAANFDHLKTGYALTGKHVQVRCESCHQNGIFKGTPRDCGSCHLSGMRFSRGNVVMPTQHLPTQLACDSCHTTQSFTGARFNHQGVAPGSCASCHNGATGSGKPSGHLQTSASCDSCHRTQAWSPAASFDHAGVAAGTCSTCHGAGRASGKPANHVPYASIATAASANCDTCHRGGFSTWANARLHANVSVTVGCASCHSGSYLNAVGKPPTPIHSGVTTCESCHNTSGWAGAQVSHASFNASTNCASCHNGSAAAGKPGTHVPTTASCFSCHNLSPAGWRPTKWNHTQVTVTGACASCHTGSYPPADGRPPNHIPYQAVAMTSAANCDGCHRGSTSTWANGRLHANFAIATGCASCHSGAYLNAVGKPNNATHAAVTGNCESCHRSTSTWLGARTDHATFSVATNCASCHNGSAATGKPGTHVPTTAGCFSCHNVSPAGWTPTKWNHTQVPVTAACATCHTGSYPPADGRPTNHVPYQAVPVTAAANCDSCHRGSTTTWANGRVHANFPLSTHCANCHSGAYLAAVGKPGNATHAAITGNCESCHRSTTNWGTVTFAHSAANAVGTGTCDTCHNGTSARGKPATHIPVPAGAARCDSCHRSQASWTASVTMNHSVVTAGQCKSCHNGSYLSAGTQGALAKPTNHIPEATQLLNGALMDCNACHTSTASWGSMTMNHNGSQGNGAGWCKGCHTRGQTWLGIGETKALTHERSTGVTDCSQSSCHRPLGTRGTPYRSW